MRPTAIKPHQCPAFFEQKGMVFGAEDLSAQRLEDNTLLWQ
jgi:hypothetical protein